MIKELDIEIVSGRDRKTKKDILTEESPVSIYFNNKEIATLLSSPADLECLAVGFLFNEGFIAKKSDIAELKVASNLVYVNSKNGNKADFNIDRKYFSSGCGRGIIYHNPQEIEGFSVIETEFKIKVSYVEKLLKDFDRRSVAYAKTGCVHSAALCSKKNILLFKEDIGRHNAVDKVIGEALLKSIPTHNKVVMSSGRLSSDMVLKTARAKVPVLISRSAPTSLAVKLARKLGLCLVGFARFNKLNVYSKNERIC